MAKRKSAAKRQRQRPGQRPGQRPVRSRSQHQNRNGASKSDYFLQPGKRGAVVVLRKPCGNRATPKVCGIMPSRGQAKMLVTQLEKAESVVNDLFLEATDDGIEALEAVLAACRDAVLKRTGGNGNGQSSGGGRTGGEPEFQPPADADPLGNGNEDADT